MRFLLSGGGTGGHITPLLAVAHELKKSYPDCYVIYVGERNGKFSSMLSGNNDIDEIRTVFAGKFRRYHGESIIKRITDYKTILFNLRDVIYLIFGIIQSLVLIPHMRIDVAFLKGGFVGVPVGLSCAFWRRKFITHDSDAMPGLANRMVGRWATVHATALPAANYNYQLGKIAQVGVVVGKQYTEVNDLLKKQYRSQIGIPTGARLLMITGGSGGAQAINLEIARHVANKIDKDKNLYLIHQVGIGKLAVYKDFTHPRLKVFELLGDMYKYSGAADVIVTRAGANTLAEFGVQKKACIVVPNPLLTGGHQIKNAQILKDSNAAIIVDESSFGKEQGSELWDAAELLLSDKHLSEKLATKLYNMTNKDASVKIAEILVEIAKNNQERIF